MYEVVLKSARPRGEGSYELDRSELLAMNTGDIVDRPLMRDGLETGKAGAWPRQRCQRLTDDRLCCRSLVEMPVMDAAFCDWLGWTDGWSRCLLAGTSNLE